MAASIFARGIAFPLVLFTAGLAPVHTCAGQSGTWSATGSLATARDSHTATLLPNGKVLIIGGRDFNTYTLASAELYDPASGSWAPTGSLATARFGDTATLLPNGNVLVAGGLDGATLLASAELYDPTSGTWAATGSLNTTRTIHTATLLPNGEVLVACGFNGPVMASAELYDPTSGTWTVTGNLATARDSHTATLLPNGKVLVAGGYPGGAGAELYDPASGTWVATGSLATARGSHTATLLASGKVLVAGGYDFDSGSSLASAELYDPASGSWSATGSLNSARNSHTATLLASGKVLVAGGLNGTSLASAELYDPASGIWTANGNLATGRFSHTATLLPSGKVLVAGGFNGTASLDGTALASAELYDPQNPISGAKALNISARVGVETGDNIAIEGFIINNDTTSKTVVIRAIGPSLANPTPPVAGTLADPVLELHKPDGSILTNNNWKDNTSTDQAIIVANGLDQLSGQPINDLESVLVATLPPADPSVSGSGEYTVIVSGSDGSTGIGLVEVYDLDDPATTAELANFSTRGFVDTVDNVLIGGFILGNGSSDVIVRALGPSLTGLGVAGALQDPILELHDGFGTVVGSNDNWRTNQEAEIIATGVAPTEDLESALVATLPSGSYTAIVRGKNGTTGVGLVEIYSLN